MFAGVWQVPVDSEVANCQSDANQMAGEPCKGRKDTLFFLNRMLWMADTLDAGAKRRPRTGVSRVGAVDAVDIF